MHYFITNSHHVCLKHQQGQLLILHKKFFANLDKTKDFRGSKVSMCLIQREILYSIEKHVFIRACAFAKFVG